jgi:hypothetical protein
MLLELTFQVLNVALAIANLGIETIEHHRVVSRLAHHIGGRNERFFTLNLADDVSRNIVLGRIHVCG